MTISRNTLSKSETVTVAGHRGRGAGDHRRVPHYDREKSPRPILTPGPSEARATPVASFATGVIKDKAAVSAAIALRWSNGQTEGQITKLKLVKRQMYGRGKLDLLQAWLRPTWCATMMVLTDRCVYRKPHPF
jgi:hypothetical protein